jgi:Ca2+-binding EF-hand superfamily protein
MQVEDIVKEASKLSEEARASIASRLIHSLDTAHHWVSDEEVSARMREADEDASALISFNQFVSGIKRSGS